MQEEGAMVAEHTHMTCVCVFSSAPEVQASLFRLPYSCLKVTSIIVGVIGRLQCLKWKKKKNFQNWKLSLKPLVWSSVPMACGVCDTPIPMANRKKDGWAMSVHTSPVHSVAQVSLRHIQEFLRQTALTVISTLPCPLSSLLPHSFAV